MENLAFATLKKLEDTWGRYKCDHECYRTELYLLKSEKNGENGERIDIRYLDMKNNI